MMQAMAQMPEQFYKPDHKEQAGSTAAAAAGEDPEQKPQLKLNLNIGVDDGKWNSVICSPDLKKIGINTPELDRICAETSVFDANFTLPPVLDAPDGPVQGPSMSSLAGEEEVTRSFIAALRGVHERNEFKSDTFNIATSAAASSAANSNSAYLEHPAASAPAYKPADQCITSAGGYYGHQMPVSSYGGYSTAMPPATQYMQASSYLTEPPMPAYPEMAPAAPANSKMDTYIPDPNQIDKLNLTTAEKLNIYTNIPIHEVGDPELQERLKSERKKMRNRIAASKCRKRKLQKEAELEDKVKVLKKKNTDLSSQLHGLREEVKELKVKMMSHVDAGCNIKPVYSHPDSHMHSGHHGQGGAGGGMMGQQMGSLPPMSMV